MLSSFVQVIYDQQYGPLALVVPRQAHGALPLGVSLTGGGLPEQYDGDEEAPGQVTGGLTVGFPYCWSMASDRVLTSSRRVGSGPLMWTEAPQPGRNTSTDSR